MKRLDGDARQMHGRSHHAPVVLACNSNQSTVSVVASVSRHFEPETTLALSLIARYRWAPIRKDYRRPAIDQSIILF